MRGIVNVLLLLITLTGPIAVAMLVLGADRGRRRRNVLIGIATAAATTFTLATYVEVSGLPPSGVGSEAGPQDAPGFAIANAFLAGLVYLLVWGICKGIDSLRRRLRERHPPTRPATMNRAKRRSAERIARRR